MSLFAIFNNMILNYIVPRHLLPNKKQLCQKPKLCWICLFQCTCVEWTMVNVRRVNCPSAQQAKDESSLN